MTSETKRHNHAPQAKVYVEGLRPPCMVRFVSGEGKVLEEHWAGLRDSETLARFSLPAGPTVLVYRAMYVKDERIDFEANAETGNILSVANEPEAVELLEVLKQHMAEARKRHGLDHNNGALDDLCP